MSKVRQMMWPVAIAGAVSVLPLIAPFTLFLAAPGALVVGLLFSSKVQLTNMPLRLVCNFIVWSIGLYYCAVFWKWRGSKPAQATPPPDNRLFILWLILLVPWVFVWALSGMAFDGGYTPEAYAFVWSVWTYPITVGIAALLRKRVPWAAFLPLVNMAGCFTTDFLHKLR